MADMSHQRTLVHLVEAGAVRATIIVRGLHDLAGANLREVEAALKEADSLDAKWISNETVMKESAALRAQLLKRG